MCTVTVCVSVDEVELKMISVDVNADGTAEGAMDGSNHSAQMSSFSASFLWHISPIGFEFSWDVIGECLTCIIGAIVGITVGEIVGRDVGGLDSRSSFLPRCLCRSRCLKASAVKTAARTYNIGSSIMLQDFTESRYFQ